MKSINDFGYRDILLSGERVVDLLVFPESYLVGVVHIELRSVEAVLGSRKPRRDALRLYFVVASLELGRIKDVEVVGDSSVGLYSGVEMVEECLSLIPVAEVIERETEVEVLGGLVFITAF